MNRSFRGFVVAAMVFATAVPSLAAANSDAEERAKCRIECNLLLEDCAKESLTLTEKIQVLQKNLEKNADAYSVEELRAMRLKLQSLRQELRDLNRK